MIEYDELYDNELLYRQIIELHIAVVIYIFEEIWFFYVELKIQDLRCITLQVYIVLESVNYMYMG